MNPIFYDHQLQLKLPALQCEQFSFNTPLASPIEWWLMNLMNENESNDNRI